MCLSLLILCPKSASIEHPASCEVENATCNIQQLVICLLVFWTVFAWYFGPLRGTLFVSFAMRGLKNNRSA